MKLQVQKNSHLGEDALRRSVTKPINSINKPNNSNPCSVILIGAISLPIIQTLNATIFEATAGVTSAPIKYGCHHGLTSTYDCAVKSTEEAQKAKKIAIITKTPRHIINK